MARRRSASTGSFGNIRGSSRSTILRGARGVQTGEAMLFERALPGEKLFLRQLEDTASLLDRDPAASHGSDHRSFAADYPSLGVRMWQLLHQPCPAHQFSGKNFHGIPPSSTGSSPTPAGPALD